MKYWYRNLRARALTALLMLAIVGCSSLPTQAERKFASQNGAWAGALAIAGSSPEQLELRLSIDGERARVWTVHKGDWVEVKPGTFQVRRDLSSAILSSTDSGEDGDGTWVESWILVTTPVGPDELLVAWTRVVNNLDIEKASGKFVVQASGTVRRLSSKAENQNPASQVSQP